MKNLKSELSLDLECRLSPDLLLYDDKMSQVNLLEDQLGIESTEVRFENIGRENLKTAAEIYIYLNTCPDSLKPWFLFYHDLFHDQEPNQIILTLNRMMKSTAPENKGNKLLVKKLFQRMGKILPLKHVEIQRIVSVVEEKIYLSSKGDHDHRSNITNTDGMYVLNCVLNNQSHI